MSAQEIPTLKSQYAEKVAADLDLNTGEQERIREEIASLQGRLAGLEQDHALLVGMRAALGGIATAVPAPRTGKKAATTTTATTTTATTTTAKTTTAKTTTAKKATAKKSTGRKTTAVKAAAKEPAKAKAATPKEKAAAPKEKAVASKEKQVPLTELIHRHLSGQAEPKTAREIAQALKTAQPDRSVSDNLVRTTTERLVARSLAERVKQGATVYYTALPHHGEAAGAPVAAEEAVAGKETENTPVPATT
ncbi:hypothetical protein [Streptomyces sp. NBC_01006]|uniref:hypothetical protein n=1 Tax=Streptomyces sp. NBC_01006 TaxID=2903716 RepID=UPI003866B0B3|nr:hypothetical protein OG509_02915 [Streptomyces sp. NBC_01006]